MRLVAVACAYFIFHMPYFICHMACELWRVEAQVAQAPSTAPVIYWTGGIETAESLKRAGIEQIAAPPDKAESWRMAGFKVVAAGRAEIERREKLLTPRVAGRADVASATRRPWIDANGWRFARNPKGKFYYDLPQGKAAMAIAWGIAGEAAAVVS